MLYVSLLALITAVYVKLALCWCRGTSKAGTTLPELLGLLSNLPHLFADFACVALYVKFNQRYIFNKNHRAQARRAVHAQRLV